ncbi:TMEM143 family protein [Desulfobacterales bacterium HSG17]|nr:TMEM143 family protein [Desulfobacterales bacterium HSG17]
MAEYQDRERFIPFQKSEIIRLLCKDIGIDSDNHTKFQCLCRLMESIYHFEFHKKTKYLKENYYPLDPDKDTRTTKNYSSEEIKSCENNFLIKFREILNDANYEQISEEDISYAMKEESLFKINLFVDFDDFENQLIFSRGVNNEKISLKKWLVKKESVEIPVFERVALLIKFKDADYFKSKKRKDLKFEPGTMIVKLFKNIPKADMEMLFPNTQVRMRPQDIFLIAGSALGGGAAVVLKAGAGLIAMFTVLWLMARSFVMTGGELPRLGPAEISGMVGGISALAAISAFLVKQWSNYKNRKIKFMKVLGDNLYFKNMDNNSGVFLHIINDAEEEECKEAILGYYFLLCSENGLTEAQLDDKIETWFEKKHNILIDFEIKDALEKLQKLELCKTSSQNEAGEDILIAVSLDDACKKLDYTWDNFFQFNI